MHMSTFESVFDFFHFFQYKNMMTFFPLNPIDSLGIYAISYAPHTYCKLITCHKINWRTQKNRKILRSLPFCNLNDFNGEKSSMFLEKVMGVRSYACWALLNQYSDSISFGVVSGVPVQSLWKKRSNVRHRASDNDTKCSITTWLSDFVE